MTRIGRMPFDRLRPIDSCRAAKDRRASWRRWARAKKNGKKAHVESFDVDARGRHAALVPRW